MSVVTVMPVACTGGRLPGLDPSSSSKSMESRGARANGEVSLVAQAEYSVFTVERGNGRFVRRLPDLPLPLPLPLLWRAPDSSAAVSKRPRLKMQLNTGRMVGRQALSVAMPHSRIDQMPEPTSFPKDGKG